MRHPSARTARTSARAAVGVLAAAAMLPVVSTPAHAVPNVPPVPGDDRVTVYATGMSQVDLLANDTDADGDTLRLCHIETAPYRAVILTGMNLMHSVDPALAPELADMLDDLDELSTAAVVAGPRATGTKTFVYDVCDRHHVVPATVTVTVLPAPKVTVRKVAGKPGRLRVTNPSPLPLRFHWHTPGPRFHGKQVRIPAGTSTTVRVTGPRVFWSATGKKSAFQVNGKVAGIRTR